MARIIPFIPYLPIGKHAVTGDRRTAALVAADGTIDWMCLPDYDGASIFGALLDAEKGGYWRMGPAVPIAGDQTYAEHSAAVVTRWTTGTGGLELADEMVWPEEQRPSDQQTRRVLMRRLRCTHGSMRCHMRLLPRDDFAQPVKLRQVEGGVVFELDHHTLGFWASFPIETDEQSASAELCMRAGDEAWAVFAYDESPRDWSVEKAREACAQTDAFWHTWLTGIAYSGMRSKQIEHSALIIHLLGYAPSGSMVASPTASLPERIGGSRNYDYRYAWVRDASLSIAGLAMLGDKRTATRYLDWLASLTTSISAPLQVAYHINGTTDLHQTKRSELSGYRGSRPVLFGNRAFDQLQLGSMGYFADCAYLYQRMGGEWHEPYWLLLERAAAFIQEHWQEPDNGIWELPHKQDFVSSKVMGWVVLDRAIRIGESTGHEDHLDEWSATRDTIHEEVMKRGWNDNLQSFVQRYDDEALDASALLIPVMDFLPANHPRVRSTVDRIVESLSVDGLIYRFQPEETKVSDPQAMGEFEGSFLPCTFWLATAYAKAGRTLDAEKVLQRAEQLTQEVALFAEEADARNNQLLGNYPLLFSQVEYIRAVLALNGASKGEREQTS